MGAVREPTNQHVTTLYDSRRWVGFQPRSDDIIISTPAKCGTTWTQGIVSSLLWPDGDAPGALWERSRWPDVRFRPAADVLAEIESHDYRRFLKSHSPADCLPIFEDCTYIVVYRDGRDALMSWGNHRRNMRPEVMDIMNETARAEGIKQLSRTWDGDLDALLDEWIADQSAVTHLASFWPLRDEPFVTFLHYNDLKADLEGEMRRVAHALGIEIPESQWAAVVERCRLENMREHSRSDGVFDAMFDGGVDSFFNQGTNDRWKGTLTAEQLARYDRHVSDGLTLEAADWLEHGSLATGYRPGE